MTAIFIVLSVHTYTGSPLVWCPSVKLQAVTVCGVWCCSCTHMWSTLLSLYSTATISLTDRAPYPLWVSLVVSSHGKHKELTHSLFPIANFVHWVCHFSPKQHWFVSGTRECLTGSHIFLALLSVAVLLAATGLIPLCLILSLGHSDKVIAACKWTVICTSYSCVVGSWFHTLLTEKSHNIVIDLMCAGVKESEATEGESDTALQREMEVVVQCWPGQETITPHPPGRATW